MVSALSSRTYLFRGKSRATGRWLYGNLNVIGDEYYILSQELMGRIGDMEEIEPDTASQYVMGDDRNGMKLFEGDIVHVFDRRGGEFDDPIHTAVIYNQDALIWRGGSRWRPQDTVVLEVVGNIWDDFEMLEEADRRWINSYFRVDMAKGD